MIICAKYVFPVSDKPIENAGVLVRDDKIVEVGKTRELLSRYPEEDVKDLKMAAIMPGFVNLHTRLERTMLRGTVADEPYAKWLLKTYHLSAKMSSQEKYDAARVGCVEAIRTGVTTVADISFTDNPVRALDEYGLRGVVFRDTCNLEKTEVKNSVEEARREIYEWQEKVGEGRIRIGVSPSAIFETHPYMFTECARLAREENLPLQVRVGGSFEETEFIMRGTSMFRNYAKDYVELTQATIQPWLPFGVSPVQMLKNWGAFEADELSVVHAIHVDDADIATFREYGAGICSCPASEAQLGMGIAPLSDFLKAGLAVGLGSDSPAASEAHGMLSEMRFGMLLHRASYVKRFFKSSQILKLCTLGGAKVLHMDDKIGTLEPGKQADIVAVDLSKSLQIVELNPISAVINSCTSSDVELTMVGGKILYENGSFAFDGDPIEMLKKMKESRKKLAELE